MGNKIILLDSSGILHSCFHGYKDPQIAEVDGKHMDVAGLLGYCKYLRKLATELNYDHLIHVLDAEGGSHQRFSIYPKYKANRAESHPVLTAQKCLLKNILECFGHTCVKIPGIESDDIIATLAQKYADLGDEVLIISSDKDLMQLVKDGSIVLARYVDQGPGLPKTHEFYEEQDVVNKTGVRPDQVADWLAITGDSADNIPGVFRVGAKTAAKWLQEYGTLASLMTNACDIKGAAGERLREALPLLPLYRKLTGCITIDMDLPQIKSIDNEKNEWARKILSIPEDWPNDINSDLREIEVPSYPSL